MLLCDTLTLFNVQVKRMERRRLACPNLIPSRSDTNTIYCSLLTVACERYLSTEDTEDAETDWCANLQIHIL